MKHSHFHTNYEHLKPKLLKVVKEFDANGVYVTEGARNVIKKFEIEDEVFNIKSFKKPGFFNAFVYKFIRPSKAKRSFDYAVKLLDFGILTPFPVAYIEEKSVLGLGNSYYICKHVDYDFDFRNLIHETKFENRNEILRQFTDFCFKLHENNVNFLDHSPGNTLIIDNKDSTYDFYLIDLNRLRFERLSLQKRMYNLRRLWLSKTMIKVIAQRYSELYGETYDQVWFYLHEATKKFKHKIVKKQYLKRKLKR